MSKLQRWLLVKRITHTYVLVVHVAEQLDFPQRPLGVDVVVEGIANLLDRNLLACLRVHSRTTNTGEGERGKYISTSTAKYFAAPTSYQHKSMPKASGRGVRHISTSTAKYFAPALHFSINSCLKRQGESNLQDAPNHAALVEPRQQLGSTPPARRLGSEREGAGVEGTHQTMP